jgi:signal peptidase II
MKINISIFSWVAFIAIIIDQLTKASIRKCMTLNASCPIFPDIFHLTYIQNLGAAFGILPGKRIFLLVIASVVAAFVVIFHKHIRKRDILTQVALGFIFGGSVGNILDRFFLGSVTDFFDMRFWPIFNFADIFINVGVFLLIIKAFQSGMEKHGADNI